jgi:hypothetical protein
MKLRILALCALLGAAVFFIPVYDAGSFELFDGRVVIHGKISQQALLKGRQQNYDELHDIDWFNMRTTFKLETLWHAYAGPEYEVNFYAVWKNFYDAAHEADSGYRNYLRDFSGHHGVEEVKSYETFRDICRELYGEINHDLFQIRVGKQIISWGETSFERMTDVINPIDSRGNLNPAYPDFDEIKRGLWMLRVFYTPVDMPADMTFEFVVIPDFQPDRLWPAGYPFGFTNPQFNSMQRPNEQFLGRYRDKPTKWTHPEFGIRIRGFTWGFDWTLLYFYHRNDQPVVKTGKAIKSMLPSLLGTGRTRDVYHYGWQNTFGLTFNKTVDRKIPIIPGTTCVMSGNVIRGEFIYEQDKDHNEIVGQNVRRAEHDRFAFVLGWDTKIFVPKLTPWARNKLLSSSTQLFMEWVPEKHRNDAIYPWVSKRKEGHHFAAVTQSFSYELWNNRIRPGIYINYQITEGGGYYGPALGFSPTFGWNFIVRWLDFFDLGHGNNDMDFWTFEVTYEF